MEGRPLQEEEQEEELVERARGGDIVAYGELVRGFQEMAVRTAYLACRDASDAEDAVQEAFVKAHAALGGFRAGAPFRPWLLRIVANEARNRRRSAGRQTGLALRVAEDRPSDVAAPSPEAAVLLAETRATLLGALDALRDEDRMVIGCRYLLELSEAETAAALGVPAGTVKSRLSRALRRMRDGLEITAGGRP